MSDNGCLFTFTSGGEKRKGQKQKDQPNAPLLAIDDDPAIRMQTLSGNQAAVLAGEEDEAGRDLRRLARTAHGIAAELILRFVVHGGGDERGPDCACEL